MDPYIVSARKYRPSTFQSVVGQKALTATLKNAIATNRLAHSYLFCGSRGVGKTSCARIFAKTINCEHPTSDGEACNECDSCRAFNNGNSLNIIELDAASNNGVDDIRALVDQVQIPPATGRYRVFIVDEVHMLSAAAFNAFLKTLEEPPSYVIFILATTEKQKIIPTILSRCQIYDFARITVRDMIDHLAYVAQQEGFTAEPAALNIIARKADGAMRDALSIFDQVAASARGNITYQATIENLNVLDYNYYNRLLEDFIKGDVMDTWLTYKEIRDRGFDSHFFINGLADYLRDLMVARSPQTLVLLEADDDARQAMAQEGARVSAEFIFRAMSLLNDADLNYRQAANKQFLVELTLAKLCQIMHPLTADTQDAPLKPVTQQGSKTAPTPKPQPQPTVTPQPAPTPRAEATKPAPVSSVPPPPPSRTMARKAPKVILGTMSMRGESNPQEASKEEEEKPPANRNETIDPERLIEAWKAFANANKAEMILNKTMNIRLPEADGEHTFHITVENGIERDVFDKIMPTLLPYLRDAVRNDNLTFTIGVNAGVSQSPRTWSEQQVLEHMVQENPAVKDLISGFKLGLR